MASETVFECRGVHYAYRGRFPALCGLDLAIAAGERVALVGANGCGKSTLLSLLDALVFADRGSVLFRGGELTEEAFRDEAFARSFRRQVGLVFQNPDVQLFCPTVRDDIAFGPLQLGADAADVEQRIARLAETLGIGALLDRSPHQLSVGEKRKVALATSLAVEPDVLLLDEPTAGLDPRTTTHLVELLDAFARAGKTVVTATHDLHIVPDLADRVYVFGQGRTIAGCGTPEAVLADHALLDANNLIHIHHHHARDHRRFRWSEPDGSAPVAGVD